MDVSLVGIARFDLSSDVDGMLQVRRGDGLVIEKEARQGGFFLARLVGSQAAGVVPASYVEALTPEALLGRLLALSGKASALRGERDAAVAAAEATRAKVARVSDAVAGLRRADDESRAERVRLQEELDGAREKIAELELELSIFGSSSAVAPSVAAPSPPPVVRSESPEIETNRIARLLTSLDADLLPEARAAGAARPTVDVFRSSLAAVCEADNTAVPVLVERLCEHLLSRDAAGARTRGVPCEAVLSRRCLGPCCRAGGTCSVRRLISTRISARS
jgi:hypothetical protein